MKDIKELIHAAVEENAVKFQELVNAQLQVRAYDAIEALRPEVGASMFGESSHKKMDDEEMDDEEEMEDEDEDEMDDKKKSMKEALHPNQQKIDVVDDEKIDAKDFAKLRQMKKMKEEVEAIDESVFDSKDAAQAVVNKLKAKHDDGNYHVVSNRGKHRVVHAYDSNYTVKKKIAALKEEVEVDEAVRIRDRAYSGIERGHGDDKTTFQGKMDRMHIAAGAKARRKRTGPGVKGFNSAMRPAKASDGYQPRETGSVRAKNEEVVNEVAMPKNAADWQALITHQIQTVGHPVATDAQFRATTVGKDMSKRASLEPGQDKMHYAAAQGGTVKEQSEIEEASYSAKAARAGKDIGKPGKMFSVIAKKAGEKYGSEERGKKVAGAVLAKLRAK
jgi:hypothetical protein